MQTVEANQTELSVIDQLLAENSTRRKGGVEIDRYVLTTNELEEGLNALEMMTEQLDLVLHHPHRWKWAILSLDNALTVLLAWAVRHSSGCNVLDFGKGTEGRRKNQQWWDSINGVIEDGQRVKRPQVKMKGLHALIKEATHGHIQFVHCENLSLTELQKKSIDMLHDLRNRFQHFEPSSWTIFPMELPIAFREVIAVIAFLMDRMAPFKLFRGKSSMRPRASRALQRALLALDGIEEAYGRLEPSQGDD